MASTSRDNAPQKHQEATMTVPADLPEAAWAAVLQHVPVDDRLTCCALVCRAWAAAAAVATADLSVVLSCSQQTQQLQDWLGKHGGVVQQLTTCAARSRKILNFRAPPSQRLQLPVQQLVQLRRLDLSSHECQLAPQGDTPHSSTNITTSISTSTSKSSNGGSSREGIQGASGTADSTAALLPQLQELRLSNCKLTLPLLLQLLSATTLSKLQWQYVVSYNDSWTTQLPDDQVLSNLWQLLQRLPSLSELQLVNTRGLTVADIAPVSALQQLRSFDVFLTQQTDVPSMAALVPAGLTALTVHSVRSQPAADMPPAAHITRLSSLASLELQHVRLAPSCLSSLTGLCELHLCAPVYADHESGPRELLGALQHLTQLRHLLLQQCLEMIEEQQQQQQQEDWQGGCHCFSALTASSQLRSLAVIGVFRLPLPSGAVDHMFPAGRVLPHLRELAFECEGWQTASTHCVEAAEVARIAASCPALQQLKLHGVTPHDFDSSCLLQLPPGLTITNIPRDRL